MKVSKRVVPFLVALVLFAGSLFVPEMDAAAAQVQDTGQEFYLHYAQPSIGDNQGYVNFLFYSPSRGYYINTIFWNIYCYTKNGDSLPVQGEITVKNNGWEFHPYTQMNNYNGTLYSLYMYNADGYCYHLKSSSTDSHVHTTSGTIIGYQAFGNVKINDTYLGNANGKFTVYYATDGSAPFLMQINDLLTWLYNLDVDIYYLLDSILSSVDDLEAHFRNAISYLDSMELKLENIFSELKENMASQSVILQQGNALQEEANKDQDIQNELQEESNKIQEEQKETSKNIFSSISDFFGGFFDNLIDAIVGVFVPDQEFFQAYFDDLYNFFHQKLGFLLYPFELLGKLLNVYLNLDEGSGDIVIPDIKMFDVALLPATTFNLKEAFSAVLGDYYDIYYAFVDIFFLIAFVNLAKRKFDKIVH